MGGQFDGSPAKSRTFLEILPLEIRSLIFRYVFRATKGCIQLIPTNDTPPLRYKISHDGFTDPLKEICLSVLRTCRQIYDECADLIWKYNTLKPPIIHPISLLPIQVKQKARSVEVNWDFLDTRRYYDRLPLELDLFELKSWSNLRSLTIQARSYQVGADLQHADLLTLLDVREQGPPSTGPPGSLAKGKLFNELLWILHKAGGAPLAPDLSSMGGYLSHLKREILFDSGEPRFNKRGCPERTFDSVENPNDMLQDIASAFGGNLLFDGVLRFRDRKPMSQIWVGPLVNLGARQFGYATDVDATIIARAYVEAVSGDVQHIVQLFAMIPQFSQLIAGRLCRCPREKRPQLIKEWIRDGNFPDLTLFIKSRTPKYFPASTT